MIDVPHVEVDVFEPLSPGQRRDGGVPPVFLHLYETCPSVRRAIARDGEVLQSHGFLDEVLAREPKLPLCAWCAYKWSPEARYGASWFWRHRNSLRTND